MTNVLPTTMEYFDNLLGEQLTDGGGGGGSSDFSTATVTIINQTELPVAFETVQLIDDDEKYMSVSTNIFGGQTNEIEVVLYNGICVDSTNINSNQVPITIAVTGDIEIVEATALSITGDGTITITAESET